VDYRKLIERVDKPFTFFYLDPPYYGCEDYYGKGIFSRADFQTLGEMLGAIQGKFILSINDLPETRNIFGKFNIREVKTTYCVAGANKKKAAKELLITNYAAPETK
jgi:DNA adenine methylase